MGIATEYDPANVQRFADDDWQDVADGMRRVIRIMWPLRKHAIARSRIRSAMKIIRELEK